MGMDYFALFFMLLLSISGGNGRHNDALDMIPTDAYWQAKQVTVSRAQLEADIGAAARPPADIPQLVKNLESLARREDAKKQLLAIGPAALEALQPETKSEDPEAAAMARDIIDAVSQHAKAQAVRRLMAIRTLGERREKESLPLLTGLLGSKEMFVAEYADRAIASINAAPPKPQEFGKLADDLNMLPATTGILAQTTGLGMPGFTLDTFLAAMDGATPPGGAPPANKESQRTQMISQLLDILDAVGNCRIDGATLGVSADIGGNNEWVVISFRGVYDRQAVADYLSKKNPGSPVVHVDSMLRIDLDPAATLLLPSDGQAILVSANPSDTKIDSILDPMMSALTTGKPGTLADNQDLAALLKTVDQTAAAWAIIIPSAKMRTLPAFGAFNSIVLEATQDKASVKITATARGTGNAQAAIDQFNSFRVEMLQAQANLVAMSKDFQPFFDGMQSVVLTADDKGATGTATVSTDIVKSAMAGIIMSFRIAPMRAPEPVTIPPQGLP